MIWLVAQMWGLLLVAFVGGVAVGVWGAKAARAGAGTGRDLTATAPLNLLSAPAGMKDDLTEIIGIDTATQARLNRMGVYHFDQIAGWDGRAARWVEAQLNDPERVMRERWMEQAQSLT